MSDGSPRPVTSSSLKYISRRPDTNASPFLRDTPRAHFSASLPLERMALFELAMPFDESTIKQAIDDLADPNSVSAYTVENFVCVSV